MRYINKFLRFSLCLTLFLCIKVYGSVSGYSVEELQENKTLLRAIATTITSKNENIIFIKNELRRKHGLEAFKLWSAYNQDSMPNVEGLKKLKLSNDITQGKPIDSKFRTNNFRPLVGRTTYTFFTDEIIDQIEKYLHEVVKNGHISIDINPMLAEKSKEADVIPDSLKVMYHLPLPLAEVFEKEKTVPPTVASKGKKDNLVVVMYAEEFITALLSDKGALEKSDFQGRINSVFIE